jgi:hypothetical protein
MAVVGTLEAAAVIIRSSTIVAALRKEVTVRVASSAGIKPIPCTPTAVAP